MKSFMDWKLTIVDVFKDKICSKHVNNMMSLLKKLWMIISYHCALDFQVTFLLIAIRNCFC